MAMFNGNKRVSGSRSHTMLIKSGHASPAEKWILDPSFKDKKLSAVFRDGVLMDYQYGGDALRDVVIPQGRVVGVSKPVKDFETKKMVTTMTLPGMATENNTIGMVPYNIAKDGLQEAQFGGNAPSIVTQEYISLPLIPGVQPSTKMDMDGVLEEEKALTVDLKMPWGAVIGKGIVEGCYLKATASGRLSKWDKTKDNFADVVGQVLALDFNQEMWGWYKWVLFDQSVMKEDGAVINRSGNSSLPSDAGWPYDPTYTEGNTMFQQFQTEWVTNPTGIPNLHNGAGDYPGFGKNDTEYKEIEIGTVPNGVKDDQLMSFQAKDFAGGNLVNLKEVTEVKLDGTAVDVKDYTIDHKQGLINITLKAANAGKKITATYTAMHYGTPSWLDFKGVVGAVFVLLKK